MRLVLRPALQFQLCAPPLQLKGILIGWGMPATSCITEPEPILLAAGWCISDVFSSSIQVWRLLSRVWRRMWEASVGDGSSLSLYVGHHRDLWRPWCFLVAKTQTQESEPHLQSTTVKKGLRRIAVFSWLSSPLCIVRYLPLYNT